MILQAIETKYIGATNTKPSRISAKTASGQSLTVSYDHALNGDENHKQAALKLMKKLGWDKYDVAQGSTKNGYVFVLTAEGRKNNPAPRIGSAKPRRKSQVTGEKPTMRLVQRREKNTRKGYYPNPLGYTVSVKPPSEKSFTQIASINSDVWAKDFAKRIAAKNPSWVVKVEKK